MDNDVLLPMIFSGFMVLVQGLRLFVVFKNLKKEGKWRLSTREW
jgi:hypothetical protein